MFYFLLNSYFSRSSRPEVFFKKGVLKNFTKFTRKRLCQSLFFNNVAGLRPATSIKKRLWQRCFLWILPNFYKEPFYSALHVAVSVSQHKITRFQYLTHLTFNWSLSIYLKNIKNKGFLTFPGDIERNQWLELGCFNDRSTRPKLFCK